MAEFNLFSVIGSDWIPLPGKLPSAVSNLSDVSSVIAAYCTMKKLNKKGIFIIDNTYDVLKISSLFHALFGRMPLIFPEYDFNFDTVDSVSGNGIASRKAVLERIRENEYDVIITTVDAICMPVNSPENTVEKSMTLSVGVHIDISEICTFLTENGYSMFDMVEGECSFSRRGGILDVFIPGDEQPIRIEFFDDEIERISHFDIITQRRSYDCDIVKITGASNTVFGSDINIIDILEKEYEKTNSYDISRDIESLKNGLNIAYDKYIPLIYSKIYTLFDYIEDGLVFACELPNLKKRCDFIDWQFNQNAEYCIKQGLYLCKTGDYYLKYDKILERFDGNTYLFSRLPMGYSMKLSALCEADINENTVPVFDGPSAVEDIRSFIDNGYDVFLTVRNETRAAAVKKILYDANIKSTGFEIVKSNIDISIAFNNQKVVLISDVAKKKKNTKRQSKQNTEKIKGFDDITPGDLVVHRAHGIGVYRGIKQMTSNGITKDYLVIAYDKGDTLYIPCPQLDLISKYIGAESSRVKLSRLGSSSWEKAKNKVRDESKELAKELIELYAKRLNAPGFAFSPDTEWQREFEERFEFEETDDQLICINDIKSDMEKPYPMDRLLCGDVGVGKTEVALRAAFKAVSDSKQVAILVPTTILANQHYNTIKERFKGYPVNVEVLSRFKTRQQQQKIVRDLKNGSVDIVIATHRLLQKDIEFFDLGLLIVDEEQRFGVKHKEKIKEMAIGVDVLTMSATPIPRTLNMAMSGIRDISIIEETPSDRLPVMTYVLEYNFDIIEQAILREMRRNGCVFYLKNDIEALEIVASRISSAIPNARIITAHGKMAPSEIEQAWQSVCDHQVDILLCTTIIETGIDVSFANTLIIEDADRMGLAQLHQIRGRVGRSSRRAYAYLTYRRDKVPSEIAAKRLMTIKEFTEFGAGLKIAMRDLEIRGAGSILGESQHGNMNIVGYDTYMDILKSVILTEQGKTPETKPDCTVDITINAFIPESYITSERMRIDTYKRIASIESREDFDDVSDELRDRFSAIPQSVINLMRISYLRNSARKKQISDIKQKGSNLVFYFAYIDDELIRKLMHAYKGKMLYTTGDKPYVTIKLSDSDSKIDAIEEFIKEIEK